jgi:hypothetical protein
VDYLEIESFTRGLEKLSIIEHLINNLDAEIGYEIIKSIEAEDPLKIILYYSEHFSKRSYYNY